MSYPTPKRATMSSRSAPSMKVSGFQPGVSASTASHSAICSGLTGLRCSSKNPYSHPDSESSSPRPISLYDIFPSGQMKSLEIPTLNGSAMALSSKPKVQIDLPPDRLQTLPNCADHQAHFRTQRNHLKSLVAPENEILRTA